VRDYVDYSSVVVNEVIEDVLDSDALPVDIEASVVMSFNPVQAEPELYPTLRQMRSQEQFQSLIARDLQDIVRKHLNRLASVQGQGMLQNVKSLEGVIAEQLEGRAALGLTPASTRPVMVHVRAPQKVKEAYQSLWARSARVREESQTLLDIKELAGELNLPYEDAFQLFYIMQRGTPLARTSARRSLRGQEPGLPPVYVIQPPGRSPEWATEPPDTHLHPGAADQTAEHPAVEVPPAADDAADDQPDVPRIIEDPDRAPDPFDVRRKRRDSRRSRRLDD
jgi:hypothetical protein